MNEPQEERQICFTNHWLRAQPVVAGYLSSALRDGHAVDDLLQEIALILYRRYDDYDEERPFAAWALGVARIKLLEQLRSGRREPLLFRDEEVLEALGAAAERQEVVCNAQEQALRHCVEGLRDRLRQALRLRYHDDCDAAQIASRLGLSQVNVRSLLRRGRDALRECMERMLNREPA